MSVNNAYRLCIAILKQDASGTTYSKIKDSKDKLLKWGLTSVIPTEYDFTNMQIGDATIEPSKRTLFLNLAKRRSTNPARSRLRRSRSRI